MPDRPRLRIRRGHGAADDPYQIATAAQLISIGSDPNLLDKHFVLLNDIDLDPNLPGGRVFTQAVIPPLPGDYAVFRSGIPFTGSLDGRGHTVYNLTIRAHGASDLGLFGRIGKRGVVRDLGIADADVGDGTWFCGALAGTNEGCISRCYARARVSGAEWVGVLVGENHPGEIVDCWAEGQVTGLTLIGGLVGQNGNGSILNSHASSRVISRSAFSNHRGIGGLTGENYGAIVNCYATGDVSGLISLRVGGLVGANWGNVVNCHAAGDVSATRGTYLGGLVGNQGGEVVDSHCVGQVLAGENSTAVGGLAGSGDTGIRASFWDIEASGLIHSSGGTGLATAQMQDAATFLAADWDWVGERANGTADLWFTPEGGGYPMLTFQSDAFQPHRLDGSGTADDPYRIVTTEDLGAINHYDLAGCYRLEADIELAAIIWKKSPVPYFNGRLDGTGRTVFNLRVRGGSYLGLFGMLDQNASVVNLGIHDANIAGTGTLGMLAAINNGRIAACRADGTVSGIDGIGGLICSNRGSISDSYATGEVAAVASTGVGGLTGWNAGWIGRCYAAAHVTSTIPVQGHLNVTGGLVGDNDDHGLLYPPGQVYGSCFLIDIDGGGPDNGFGVPLTDAQMRQQASFAGWDFEGVWTICEGRDYPRLRWEGVQCER